MTTESDQVLIEAVGLSKAYGPVLAVDHIDFQVRRGEIVGFLGPNGAGKTTTMKILTCFIAPTSGRASVAGHDTLTESMKVRRAIGYLPEDTPLYHGMSVLEFLRFVSDVREVGGKKATQRIKETTEICGLGQVLGRPIGHLSKGYRQRVGLAQAMLHDPDILILDEPWTGLDPNQISDVRQLIKELGKDKTVVLSTHILAEVEQVCDRVLVIDRGKIVSDELPETLIRQKGKVIYRLIVEGGDEVRSKIKPVLEKMSGVEDVQSSTTDQKTEIEVYCRFGQEPAQTELTRACSEQGSEVQEIYRTASSLEDVFRELTVGDRVEIGVRAS
jgi:ABC-2 type transport system ATP-binding protein